MAVGQYKITEDFEKAICDYTGAPFCVVVDSCSHAIFLSLYYELQYSGDKPDITIPKRTFPSVPCEIIHAGAKVIFGEETFKGIYNLAPTKVWDCALRFTVNMYKPDTHMCISFTGPRKLLKLIKGGAILTDDEEAVAWFKSARMSGRHEMPFMEDTIEVPGWNYYIMPELSARGLALIRDFYDEKGNPLPNEDVVLEYPDLSLMPAFK
jgi:dTDP-4-amino-4,6-dideoxygalactose transaminase